MSARSIPARRIRKPKIKMEASELRSSTFTNKVAKRKVKRREWREADEDIRSRWASNLARYQALLFNQKIEFALRGYIFPDQEDNPAIYVGKTSIKMPDGSDRCVRAGKLFEKLPEGFVILYSKLEVTDQPTPDELQQCYQVKLQGKKYLQTHPDPVTDHGLGQFINNVTKRDAEDQLKRKTRQRMSEGNCEIRYPNRHMSPEYRLEFPAYVMVVKDVKPHQELLCHYGSGHDLT